MNHTLANDGLPPTRGQAKVPDVISALNRMDGQLASREQRVANYVKDNIAQISTMSIADLALGADVSTPTVIRFCRSLGCSGFKEFKLRLAQNLAVSLQYLHDTSVQDPPSVDQALDRVLTGIYGTTKAMRQQIDARTLEDVVDTIVNCRQMLVAGIGGGSSMLADEAANRFFRLGIPTSSTNDSYVLQMRAATLGPNDVLLLFSSSGETEAIVGAAQVAQSYEANTIALTCPGSKLANIVTHPIAIELPEDPDIFKPTASRYAFLALLDTLAMMVATENPEVTRENLRKIRASLTAYHGRTGPQPLGD